MNYDINKMFENLKITMQNFLIDGVFPGSTFSITDGEKSCLASIGNKALIPEIEKNNLHTLYDMASLTKVIVTTTLALIALQKGKLKLDDKVSSFLKEYPNFHFTIRNLVSHTSGLPVDFDIPNIHSQDDFEKQLINLKPIYPPDIICAYSDPGYIILGKILETVYGSSLETIAQEEIFSPLDMRNSTFKPTDINLCAPTEFTEERGIVRGKTHDEKGYYSKNTIGHAGLFSNITDITKFANMILNKGKVNGEIFLEEKYFNLMFEEMAKEDDGTVRSFGWILGNNNSITGNRTSELTISHTGFTGTSIVIDIENKLSVIVLTNRVHPTRDNRRLIAARAEIANSVFSLIKNKIKK